MSDTIKIIQPAKKGLGFPAIWMAIWQYRELLWVLALRDIRIRYKQTAVGIAWAVVQPLTTLLIFSMVFGRLAHLPSEGLPYPVFCLAALAPWLAFQRALMQSSLSLVLLSSMISKVFFPRLVAPFASVIIAAIDYLIGMACLVLLALWYQVPLGPHWFYFPFFFLMGFLVCVAASVWLSMLNAHYRDVQFVLPLLLQVWLYVTPVAYPYALIPDKWKMLYALNPMVLVIEGGRWSLFSEGTFAISPPLVWASVAVVIGMLITGLIFFNQGEKTLVDVV